MSINKPLIEQSRSSIKRICEGMISGDTSFVEGAREILKLSRNARLKHDDEDLIVFIGIASETDEVPGEEQLKHWSKAVSATEAARWAELEDWARNYGATACNNFISRF